MEFEQPDTDDLLQEEGEPAPMTPIPVVVDGPVRTQRPGARGASMANLTIGPDIAVPVAGEDLRRSRALLYATTGTAAFYIGTDRRRVQDGSAARFNSGVMVELQVTAELFARSATDATDCQLSVILENWAD